MRKKSLLAIAMVLLLAVAVLAMSVGSSAAPSTSRLNGWKKPTASTAAATAAAEHGAKGATRLVVIARPAPGEDQLVDVGPAGDSPGDYVVFAEDLITPAGRPVGHDQSQCKLMFRDEVSCQGSFIFDGKGQIIVEGVLGETLNTLAVTGGTGRFRNARGQAFLFPGPNEGETRFVFALLL
jgi:hypothetical protein